MLSQRYFINVLDTKHIYDHINCSISIISRNPLRKKYFLVLKYSRRYRLILQPCGRNHKYNLSCSLLTYKIIIRIKLYKTIYQISVIKAIMTRTPL